MECCWGDEESTLPMIEWPTWAVDAELARFRKHVVFHPGRILVPKVSEEAELVTHFDVWGKFLREPVHKGIGRVPRRCVYNLIPQDMNVVAPDIWQWIRSYVATLVGLLANVIDHLLAEAVHCSWHMGGNIANHSLADIALKRINVPH